MADSSVPVTPGSGANVDTRTQGNGDHRQVVVLGDASTADTAGVTTSGEQRAALSSGGVLLSSMAPGLAGKQALDVNLVASQSGMAVVSGVLGVGVSVTCPVAAAGNVTITLSGGTYTALTIAFEASDDSGTTYYAMSAAREDGTGALTQESFVASTNRMWTAAAPGMTHIRVRTVTYSGSAAPSVRITPGPFLVETSPVINVAAGVNLMGSVAPSDGLKATYSATQVGIIPTAAGANAILMGSATKTIRLVHVEVSLTAGTASLLNVSVVKVTGTATGTAAAMTALPHDSNDAAATAVAQTYLAAAAGLTVAGYVRSQRVYAPTTQPQPFAYDFGDRAGARALVARGTTQGFAILLSTVPTTPVLSLSFEWTEE